MVFALRLSTIFTFFLAFLYTRGLQIPGEYKKVTACVVAVNFPCLLDDIPSTHPNLARLLTPKEPIISWCAIKAIETLAGPCLGLGRLVALGPLAIQVATLLLRLSLSTNYT